LNNNNIWQFQVLLSRRLFRWAVFSMVAGILMRFAGKFWRGMGNQFLMWGTINALISVFGRSAAEGRNDKYENPGTPEVLAKETRNLRTLLLVNAGLDVLYILFGRWLASRHKGEGLRKGNGWGVIIQGAFLLVFDILHAAKMPDNKE